MNIPTKTIVKVLAVTFAFLGLLYFAYLTRTILVWMITAFALSLALNPAVVWFQKVTPKHNRLVATTIVSLLLMAVVTVLAIILVPPLITQTEQLAGDLPRYTNELTKHGTFTGDLISRYHLVDRVKASQSDLVARLSNAGGTFIGVLSGVFSSIIASLTIIGLTFFMLMEGPNWISLFWRTQTNRPRRERLQRLAGEMYQAVGGYVVGKLAAALMAGLSATIMLIILGAPFAVPLGLIVGILSILPLIGATIGAVIVVIATLFTSVGDAIIMAIFFTIYQQIENNVIQPLIFNKIVSVSPLLVFISVLLGTTIGGILGALIAIPVTASLQILVKDIYWHHLEERAEATPAAKKTKAA
jgi:predicted PurR-regulated permease PerM